MGKTYPVVMEFLRKEFEEKKVTKYSFCKKTGINPTSVERYLHGISEPSQASLEKMAAYFGVSVAELRGEGISLDEKSVLEVVAEGFINLYLPEQLSNLIGKALLINFTTGYAKISNGGNHGEVFRDVILRVFSVLNILANYYRYEGAMGNNPYRNSPNINPAEIVYKQLTGILENELGKFDNDPPPKDEE